MENQDRQTTSHSLRKKWFVAYNSDSVPLQILLSLHIVCQTSKRWWKAAWKLPKSTHRNTRLQQPVLVLTGINPRTKTIHCLQKASGSKCKAVMIWGNKCDVGHNKGSTNWMWFELSQRCAHQQLTHTILCPWDRDFTRSLQRNVHLRKMMKPGRSDLIDWITFHVSEEKTFSVMYRAKFLLTEIFHSHIVKYCCSFSRRGWEHSPGWSEADEKQGFRGSDTFWAPYY